MAGYVGRQGTARRTRLRRPDREGLDAARQSGGQLAGQTQASAAEWVLFKLDGGLDHILVDEAQDTSPAQWSLIRALAGEFFSGTGSREEVVRTLFAVGDEKQSIYGFQGAAPEMFARMGRQFEALAGDAGTQVGAACR